MDPFLICRAYEKELRILKELEREYSQKMSKLFHKFRKIDAARIQAMKAILLNNLLAQQTILEHTMKFTNAAINSVKNIDAESKIYLIMLIM